MENPGLRKDLHGLETNTEHDRADDHHDNRGRSEGGDNQASDSGGQPTPSAGMNMPRSKNTPTRRAAIALTTPTRLNVPISDTENPKHPEQQLALKHAKVLLREIGDVHEAFQSGVLPLDEFHGKASPLCDQGEHNVVLSVQSAQLV
jgi:hypothetical protein